MQVSRALRALVLAACAVSIAHAQAALHQSAPRKIDPGQMLKPDDFTPQELAYYKQLTDPNSQKAFIITRSWEQLCQEVVDHRLPPIQLPNRPAEFDTRYLLPTEPVVINRALVAKIIANACEGKPDSCVTRYRGIVEMKSSQVLTEAQMSPDELAYYRQLTDPDIRDSFVKTRSYVRLCRQVVDHSITAADLPDKPLGFNPTYLLPGEKSVVDEATKASLMAECTSGSWNCFK